MRHNTAHADIPVRPTLWHRRGFTLIETIITLVLSVALTVLVVGTMIAGLNGIYKTRELERLHANAVVLSDAVSYWVRRGESFDVPDPATLVITLPDASTKTIAYAGGAITVEGTPVTTSDIVVSSVEFTELTRSVRFSFTLVSDEETFSATSSAALRN